MDKLLRLGILIFVVLVNFTPVEAVDLHLRGYVAPRASVEIDQSESTGRQIASLAPGEIFLGKISIRQNTQEGLELELETEGEALPLKIDGKKFSIGRRGHRFSGEFWERPRTLTMSAKALHRSRVLRVIIQAN